MSAATDGFSAMMSFLFMRRERPQRILAKPQAVQPPRAPSPARASACETECPYAALAWQTRVRRTEEVFGDQAAGGRLLVPEHHEYDQLDLVKGQRVSRGGKRTLDHHFSRVR